MSSLLAALFSSGRPWPASHLVCQRRRLMIPSASFPSVRLCPKQETLAALRRYLESLANHCSVMCARLFLRVQSLRRHLFSQNFRYLPAGRQLVAAVQKLGRLGNLSACPCSQKQSDKMLVAVSFQQSQAAASASILLDGCGTVLRCSVQFLSVKQTVNAGVSVQYIQTSTCTI